MPPCAAKTCAVHPIFVPVVGELRAANPSKCPRAHEAKCWPRGTIRGSETKVEAGAGATPRPSKPGQSAHADQPRGSFPDSRATLPGNLRTKFDKIVRHVFHRCRGEKLHLNFGSSFLQFQVCCCFGCFRALLEENTEHLQTQHSRKHRFSEQWLVCQSSGVFWDIVGLLQGSKRPLPRKLRQKSGKGFPGPGVKKLEKDQTKKAKTSQTR